MNDGRKRFSLIDEAGVTGKLAIDTSAESAWIEVIRKMDEVYADLVRYQIALEEKNAALEVAQQFIRGVLASMTDILIVCDSSGRIEQVNAALEALTGRTPEELLQQRFDTLFMPESQALAAQFPEKLATGEDERNPMAVQHIVRSFDPCMACTVH